ncbi:MAG: hypothetical protein AB7V48_03315 [Sedimentibacter sp.]
MHYKFKLLCSAHARKKDGITLAEIIISIAVLGAVIAPVMNLFLMSAEINKASNKEFMSMLQAQMYLEEIKATDNIDTSKYAFNSEEGCYERTITQTDDEFGAVIKIIPKGNLLYFIRVLMVDEAEIINTLDGSKLMH